MNQEQGLVQEIHENVQNIMQNLSTDDEIKQVLYTLNNSSVACTAALH